MVFRPFFIYNLLMFSTIPPSTLFPSSDRFCAGKAPLLYQSSIIFTLVHKIAVCCTKLFFIFVLFIAFGCSSTRISDLRNGDLLFIVNGNGNNITNVTKGMDGLGIDHVAIFADGNIIEAIPEYGVVESSLDSFMVRLSDWESVLVGRVEGLDVDASVANARKLLGKPYDDIFMPSDSAIYCSELVQKSFVFDGKHQGLEDKDGLRFVFDVIPMSFHDSTGNVTEFWTKFYAARGLAVPEGEPGTNPGQLSRDPNVKIIGRLQ